MASEYSDSNLMDKLMGAVQKEVSAKSQEIVEKHKKQMAEEIEAAMRDAISKMGLRIAKHSSITMAGDIIRIEISDRRQ